MEKPQSVVEGFVGKTLRKHPLALLFYFCCLPLCLCVECESECVSFRRSARFMCMYVFEEPETKANFTLRTNAVVRSISVWM